MNLEELMTSIEDSVPLNTEGGRPVLDGNGQFDDAEKYEVLITRKSGGYTFALVLGPSGDVDAYGPWPGFLTRDIGIMNDDQFDDWIKETFPS